MAALSGLIRLVWVVVRFPIVAVLAALQPLVSFAFTALALLMAVASAAYACAVPFHALPVVGLLAGAAGMIVLAAVYGLAVRFLSV